MLAPIMAFAISIVVFVMCYLKIQKNRRQQTTESSPNVQYGIAEIKKNLIENQPEQKQPYLQSDAGNNGFKYFYGAAFDSLCVDYQWKFPTVSLAEIRSIVVEHSGNPNAGKNALRELLCDLGFEWPEFDQCIQYCLGTGKTGWFYGFTESCPKKPENLRDLFQLMIYQDIRGVAKQLGLTKLPRKKADLIELVLQATTWENCVELSKDEYEKAWEKYRQREFAYKCEALLLSVSVREAALRNLDYYRQSAENGFNKPRLILQFDEHPDSSKLAELFMEGGYKAIDRRKLRELKRLPPFFPADRSWLNCR